MFLLKLLLIFSFFSTAGNSNELWKRTDTKEHISFLFPNTVQSLTQESNGIVSHIYQTKDLTCVFVVDWFKQSVKDHRRNDTPHL